MPRPYGHLTRRPVYSYIIVFVYSLALVIKRTIGTGTLSLRMRGVGGASEGGEEVRVHPINDRVNTSG